MQVWDFVNAINFGKQDLFEDPQAEKEYNSFLINRALSYFPDTVMYANEMNRPTIPKQWQFEFLRNAIPKRKRFSKWAKKEDLPADIDAVCQFYGYSIDKALEALSLLTDEQVQSIKSAMSTGGRT